MSTQRMELTKPWSACLMPNAQGIHRLPDAMAQARANVCVGMTSIFQRGKGPFPKPVKSPIRLGRLVS